MRLGGGEASPPEFADAARMMLEAALARGALQLLLVAEFPGKLVELFAMPDTAAVCDGLARTAYRITDRDDESE